jgi:hypothetical protein
MNRDAGQEGQEIGLTRLETSEVARGYRAESLKPKPSTIRARRSGRINDLIFGKDGNICAVPAVDDFTGLGGQLVAIPYRSLKLDDSSGYIVLPGASRSALRSKHCRFSSAVDSASYSFSSGHLFLRRIATTYQPIDNAEREDRRRQ